MKLVSIATFVVTLFISATPANMLVQPEPMMETTVSATIGVFA